MSAGRPTKYNPEYCDKILEYFNIPPYKIEKIIKKKSNGEEKEETIEIPNDLPLLSRFAAEIGVHRDTLIEWTKTYPEFSDAYKRAKELQRSILITNGLRGHYQTTFAIFTAKNITDMSDKQEIEHSGKMTFDDCRSIAEAMLKGSGDQH